MGNHFCIGSAIDFEEKVQKYFTYTNAFIELSENPFKEILDKVRQLLNKFASKKLIKHMINRILFPKLNNPSLPPPPPQNRSPLGF